MIPGTVGIVLFPSGGITNCFSILKKFRVRDCSAKSRGPPIPPLGILALLLPLTSPWTRSSPHTGIGILSMILFRNPSAIRRSSNLSDVCRRNPRRCVNTGRTTFRMSSGMTKLRPLAKAAACAASFNERLPRVAYTGTKFTCLSSGCDNLKYVIQKTLFHVYLCRQLLNLLYFVSCHNRIGSNAVIAQCSVSRISSSFRTPDSPSPNA